MVNTEDKAILVQQDLIIQFLWQSIINEAEQEQGHKSFRGNNKIKQKKANKEILAALKIWAGEQG